MREEDFHMHITKECIGCGIIYPRRRKFSQVQWEKNQHCNIKCRNKHITGGGWWYQKRNKNVVDRKV